MDADSQTRPDMSPAESEGGTSPGHVFRPIIAPRAADEVIDQITHAVRAGVYRPGDKLPAVPALAASLGVSPPIITSAVGMLAEAGVVEIRRGSRGGIVVRSSEIPVEMLRRSVPLRSATLRGLLEARRPVETELGRLAALRATRADLDELARANDALISTPREGVSWATENNRFHYAFGRAARSPALAYLQHDILEQITIMLRDGVRYSDRDRAIKSHVDTLAAIESGDPEAAAAAMDEHLCELEEIVDWFDAQRSPGAFEDTQDGASAG